MGKHHGRSYVVMELFSEDNLAVFQQKAMLSIAAIRSIGVSALTFTIFPWACFWSTRALVWWGCAKGHAYAAQITLGLCGKHGQPCCPSI